MHSSELLSIRSAMSNAEALAAARSTRTRGAAKVEPRVGPASGARVARRFLALIDQSDPLRRAPAIRALATG
jgi:hypothetical protein